MTTTWKVDPSHSEIEFKARHLMITNVTGKFRTFEGTVETEDDDFTRSKISFWADVASIDTGEPNRDAHLRSDDFFAASEHPKLTFTSTRIEKTDDPDRYQVWGTMSIRGISKEIRLDVESGGQIKDPWGNTRAGFEMTAKVNRKEFGLKWNAVTEAGGIVVSDEIRIHCAVEIVKEAEVMA
ncbi:MAG: YceI family protein [Acidobacteriota bacterium]